MSASFFHCKRCGNMMYAIYDKESPVICCGQEIEKLSANTVEASTEKHLPEIVQKGNCLEVVVGSVEHPMAQEHHIAWICLESQQGVQISKVFEKPKANFCICEGDKAVSAYAYCNLHGLWRTII